MVAGAKSGDGTVEGTEGTPSFYTIASQAFEFDAVTQCDLCTKLWCIIIAGIHLVTSMECRKYWKQVH